MADKVQVCKDSKGEWRWRQIAPNGRIVVASTEGYNKTYGEANAKRQPRRG